MIRKISFIQHNTAHTLPVQHTILQQAFEAQIDILLLQKPVLAKNQQTSN